MTDLVIRGALVIDGTGSPGYRADIAVSEGKITAIGDPKSITTNGARSIDADGLVVAPGFIDIHTHYDAQVLWDGACTPSPLHGVTTVIAGNCGFSLAPAGEEHAEYLLPMLARVEGMPLSALESGLTWSWRTTAEYFAQIEGTVTPNIGFMAGHSAIRRSVMGARAVGESATEADIADMRQLLRESLQAGALGFSSSNAGTQHDGAGEPVPSRWANETEIFALCDVVGEFPGTCIEYIPLRAADEMARMTAMSLIAKRPLNWNLMQVTTPREHMYHAELATTTFADQAGAIVKALTLPCPLELRISLGVGFMFDSLPGWDELIRRPIPERIASLRDPAERARLRYGATLAGPRRKEMTNWAGHLICETTNPSLAGLVGRTIGDVASERGADPFDTLIDLSIDDELRMMVLPPSVGSDDESWKHRAEAWRDPHVLIGGSDAGAHLDMITTFSLATQLLSQAVRERQLISLEEAVHFLTDRPARFLGLRGRGRIEAGCAADLVVFDPTVVAPGRVTTRFDLPGGAGRLYGGALGISHVVVNGREIVTDDALTGESPGTLLRSGKDTATVPIPAGASLSRIAAT